MKGSPFQQYVPWGICVYTADKFLRAMFLHFLGNSFVLCFYQFYVILLTVFVGRSVCNAKIF